MIARTHPATTTLPASLILSPRELKQYRRFQAQTTTLPPKRQGLLPIAAEYADFQSWLAKRDSGYLSDTPLADIVCCVERTSEKKEEKDKASICGHTLHPTFKGKAGRCPVCTVEMHITYMKVLTVALEDAGGLVKQRWEAVDRDCPALQAWYAGKLAFVKDICWLESLAQDEQEYEQQYQQNRYSTQLTTEAKTATQALEMYWDSMEANPTIIRSPRRKTACSVDFCPETSFKQGRDQLYFWRKSPRYEAGGKYASSSDDDGEKFDNEECEEHDSREQRPVSMAAKETGTSGQDQAEEEQSDEEASDLEDEDDEDEEDEGEDEGDEEVDAGYVVFEYDVQGAEFVVFED